MHAHVHNHVRVYTYVYLYMCEYVHLWCVCVYVCVYMWMYVCMFVCVCMYMCICVYMYVYVYMCVYVCIDIYTHTKIFIRFAVQYLLTFHSSLHDYNSIFWCWTASRNVYFELTQEDFLSFSQNTFVYLYMYICILTVFEDYSMCLLHYI